MKLLDLSLLKKRFHCGMRHPNNGQSEGDLSRLTGTSSTSSTPSSSNDNLDIENNENNLCNDNCAIISSQALILSVNDNENANNIKNSQHLHGHHHHHHHHHHGHHHHGHHHHHTTQQYGQQQNQQQQYQVQQNYPSYLPEYIDPLEWQKSRKRKERLDSTSSITQVDRKLQRSNSEELITSSDCEVIRRVSSHEDFKKQPLQERNTNIDCNEDTTSNNLKPIAENDNHSIKSVKSGDSQQQLPQQQQQNEPTNNFIIRLRLDTSPARSNNHRWSPHRFDDSSENENERRRSSERFSKTRAPPGRKSGVVKKVGSNSGSGGGKYSRRSGDENGYKYDISHLKYERRGFVSKLKLEEHRKEEAADGEPIISSSIQPPSSTSQTNDYNDNNLIDLCLQQQQQHQNQQIKQQQQQQKNNNGGIQISNQQQQHQYHQNQDASTAMPLPWDRSPQDIQTTPVLCRRFATFNDDDSTSSYNSSNKIYTTTNNNNHHHQYSNNSFISDSLSQSPTIIAAPAVIVDNEPIKSFRTFTKMENLKTREVMQNVVPLGLLQTPEERLKIVNKKLNALKKKVTLLEENYEKTYGYRPSQIERYNDKQIKTALAEINKLRKEKQELKSDPMAALGLKVSGGLDANQKLNKMKDTLDEIQNKLNEKRTESNRPESLEILSSDQLVQEKTAVQHSLLYFESLYGRPSTREERDAARPLYDRYRSLKRMITRSISIPAGGGVGSELPTILEHEAMTYETIQQQSSISTDTTTNSLSDHLISSSNINNLNIISGSTIESPTDSSVHSTTTDSTSDSSNQNQQQDQQQQALSSTPTNQQQQQPTSTNDVNLHMLSLDELWGHLEKVREEKKDLKKSIRDFENLFEEQNGRKMLKNDRKLIEDTYANYKENKAKVRLLQALIKKHMAK